jgi:hypothetical protein
VVNREPDRSTGEQSLKAEPGRYVVEGSEAQFGVTASASANVALGALRVLPPTHERNVLIEAQTYIGNLELKALERLGAALADPATVTPRELDPSLAPATIHRFVDNELTARRDRKEARSNNWKFWGGLVLGAILAGLAEWAI